MFATLSSTVTDRDLLFALIGGAVAYLSVCLMIWPIAGCIARYSFRRGPRLTRIEGRRADG